jgi:hypothetical protein
LIETSSSSENSDSNAKFDFPALMDNKDPKVRLSVYAKLKRMMNTLKGSKLKAIDRRLLRGLFLRRLNDFDEDFKEIIQNRSLLSRITDEYAFRDQLTLRNSQNGVDSPLPVNYETDFKSALEQYHRRGNSNSNDGSTGSHRQNQQILRFGDKK